jgi:hypothetical protein
LFPLVGVPIALSIVGRLPGTLHHDPLAILDNLFRVRTSKPSEQRLDYAEVDVLSRIN